MGSDFPVFRSTFLLALHEQARRRGRAPLFTFIEEGGRPDGALSVAEALAAAQGIADALRRRTDIRRGDAVLLVYPPCLEFVPALLGCIFAGVLPVPVYPPDPLAAHRADVLHHIARDAGARLALTNTAYNRARRVGSLRRLWGGAWPDLTWMPTDHERPRTADPSSWVDASADDPLLLQYTSGSTGDPRGVVITHGNVAHQLAFNRVSLGGGDSAHAVFWVPQYHDFGLISGILSAAYGNCQISFLSPLAFIKRPAVWLETIHRVRATHTAAPDFGYALAARKTSDAEARRLDLSCLRVLMTAAEPIRAETIEAFVARFQPSGLRPQAICQAYGLAEHTVGVTVGGHGFASISRAALERGLAYADPTPSAVRLARCGRVHTDIDVRIVDPDELRPRRPGEVGEIWVRSPSVAAGYWRRPEETERTFRARLPNDERAWLRTGDLGFFDDGELVICGRHKDLMIIRGRNIYPQDVERTAQAAHAALRPGNVIAFGSERSGQEELIVVAEVRSPSDAAAAVGEVLARAVGAAHGVRPAEVVLLPAGKLPKTTSGKVQRQRCKVLWGEGELGELLRIYPEEEKANELGVEGGQPPTALASVLANLEGLPVEARHPALTEALLATIAVRVGVRPEAIDPHASLQAQGADSLAMAELARTLEEHTNADVPIETLVVHPSVSLLVSWLLREVLHVAFSPPPGQDAPEAKPVQRLVGHRHRDPEHSRVAIVGGGVAGLEAAHTLSALGYRHVTVFEAQAEVGGKVRTIFHEGRPFEMGFTSFVGGYDRTLPHLHASGEAALAESARPCVAHGTERRLLDIEGAYSWADRVSSLEPAVKRELRAKPIGELLRASGVESLPPGWQLFWTAFGYGYTNDVPSEYLLTYMDTLQRSTVPVRAAGGNQEVWKSLARRLEGTGVNVRRGCPVRSVRRSRVSGLTLTLGDEREEEVDDVIFACPPRALAPWLDEPRERALFARFRTLDYHAVLLEAEGLLDWNGTALFHEGASRGEAGMVVACIRNYEDLPFYVAYQWGTPPGAKDHGALDDAALDACLGQEIEKVGGRLVRVIERVRWEYFPHLSPADLAAGTLDEIYALQGSGGRWFVGSYLAFELVELAARQAAAIITQGFGPDQAISPAERIDAAIDAWSAAPSVSLPAAGAPLTVGERFIWSFVHIVPTAVVSAAVHIHGEAETEALLRAIQRQVDRVETFRLHLDEQGTGVRLREQGPRVEWGWCHRSAAEPFEAWMEKFHARPTGGKEHPTAHFALCEMGPRHHVLAVEVTHLLIDAFGMMWLMRLLAAACRDGERADARPIPTSQTSVLGWEQAYRASDRHADDVAHWRSRAPFVAEAADERAAGPSSVAASHHLALGHLRASRIQRWSAAHGASPTTLYTLAGLICRWDHGGRRPVRTLVALRCSIRPGLFEGGLEPQIRSVPVTLDLRSERPVEAIVREALVEVAEAMKHSALDFDELSGLLLEHGVGPAWWWDVNVFPVLFTADAGALRLRMELGNHTHHMAPASFRVVEDVGSGECAVIFIHRLEEMTAERGSALTARFVAVLDALLDAVTDEPLGALLERISATR